MRLVQHASRVSFAPFTVYVSQLREENARLRDQPAPMSAVASKTPARGNPEAEAQLRDANWRLQQLQTQYDFLVSKVRLPLILMMSLPERSAARC